MEMHLLGRKLCRSCDRVLTTPRFNFQYDDSLSLTPPTAMTGGGSSFNPTNFGHTGTGLTPSAGPSLRVPHCPLADRSQPQPPSQLASGDERKRDGW